MKKSISIWSFYGNWSLEQKLHLAKEAGFAGFEIDLSEDGPLNLQSTTADLKTIRALADKCGVTLSGVATGLYWGANACSADPAVRQKAATILQKQIESAAALGVDAILVVPGAVGVDFIPGGEVVPYHLAYQRAQDFIKSALPVAEKAKVTLCVENVWNKFLLSPLEMKAFIDGFGSDRVGSYFDVGNTLAKLEREVDGLIKFRLRELRKDRHRFTDLVLALRINELHCRPIPLTVLNHFAAPL